MKFIKLIILIIFLSSFDKRDKMEKFIVINAIGDTAILFENEVKETFYVFIIEPSCNGCKDNLAKFLNKKKNLIIITNYYTYIEDRKISQKYFLGVFPNAKHIYFLPAKDKPFNILNLNSKKMPCMIYYTPKTKLYSLFHYDDIFEETYIKKNFNYLLK